MDRPLANTSEWDRQNSLALADRNRYQSALWEVETMMCGSGTSVYAEINEELVRSPWKWRLRVPAALHALVLLGMQLDGRDIYEFGTNEGAATTMLRGIFPKHRIWGFDSFQGLPEESPALDTLAEWPVGKFAVLDKNSTAHMLIKWLNLAGLIIGFFNETLTADLAQLQGMQPALYVDIDVDLHISTSQALSWLFANGLVQQGTLIGYDDWWTIFCASGDTAGADRSHPLTSGEGRAHVEIAARFGVHFVCVAGSCAWPLSPNGGSCALFGGAAPIFAIQSIAGEQAAAAGAPWDHGFAIDDVERFRRESDFCRSIHALHRRVAAR